MKPTSIFGKKHRNKIRREIKSRIIHLIKQSKIDPHIAEFVIKSFHFQQVFISFACLSGYVPKEIFLCNVIVSFGLFILFLYLDGCVLSNVEYDLCSDKKKFINIIDPFLSLCKVEQNKENRYYFTLYFVFLYYIGCLYRGVSIWIS